MDTLRGRSGVMHTFTRVVTDSNATRVVEEYSRQIDELDVLRFHVKVLDAGPCSATILAPSWTSEAQELAELYGIRLCTA